MADNLFKKLLNNEIEIDKFFEWFRQFYSKGVQSNFDLGNYIRCSQADFLTYFLNFIHEEIPLACTKWNLDENSGKPRIDLEKSRSFPLELSKIDVTSTPKITKIPSDSIITTPLSQSMNKSYMSPISPLYQNNQNNVMTPRSSKKSPLCFGDFIQRSPIPSTSRKKLSSRRINPTNITNISNFHKSSENSYNFINNDDNNTSFVRNSISDDKIKILSRPPPQQQETNVITPKKICTNVIIDNNDIKPDINLVDERDKLDKIIKIYVEILNCYLVLNLTSEIEFLLSLLIKKQMTVVVVDKTIEEPSNIFLTIHNLIYFVCNVLETQLNIIKCYDRNTIRLLSENSRIQEFIPNFHKNLIEILDITLRTNERCLSHVDNQQQQENVCFNIDYDLRGNFINDLSFHSFRKQRDLFYEILRLWEMQHLNQDYNYQMSLGGKIKTLLSLCNNEHSNFIHFARLFKSQLLNLCRNYNNDDNTTLNNQLLNQTNIIIDKEKLNRLKYRLIMKQDKVNHVPQFSGHEEFYKNFIITASNLCFNRHLCDALISEIIELNETNFNCTDLGDDQSKEIEVDLATKKEYFICIKSLRLVAKFLGFVESIPYQTESTNWSQSTISVHLKVRGQIQPNFDIKRILEESICRQSIILCIPWLTYYLSMLDHITLRLPYYILVSKVLFELYRNYNNYISLNMYLIKFCLGWLFELPHFPDIEYYNYCIETKLDYSPTMNLTIMNIDRMNIIDKNIIYLCCPYLNDIKKQLLENSIKNTVTIKHITPITQITNNQTEYNKKKLEQQLEDAFFNNQPSSVRKTSEFVSERIASTCVKYLVSTIVPKQKKIYCEKLMKILGDIIGDNSNGELYDFKEVLNVKTKEFSDVCSRDLQEICENEIKNMCENRISQAIDTLISPDTLQQTKNVAISITTKRCTARVKQWIQSHIVLSIFSRDFEDVILKVLGCDKPKNNKPTFVLPPEGSNVNHNENTISASHLLDKIRILSIKVLERDEIQPEEFKNLLDETLKSIKERGDINDCILATICTSLVDFTLLSIAHNQKLIADDSVMTKLIDIWKCYYVDPDNLFKTLLCVRNVMIFAQADDNALAWKQFAKFCAQLFKHGIINSENFESQCTGIFSTDWDENTLKHITNFFKDFLDFYKKTGCCRDDFTFLLGFLSDYCEDL